MKTITQTLAFLALITTSTYCLANTSFSIKNKLESKVTLTVTGDEKGGLYIHKKRVEEGHSIPLDPDSTTKANASHTGGSTDITFVLSYTLNSRPINCTFYIETNNGLEIQRNAPASCGVDDNSV